MLLRLKPIILVVCIFASADLVFSKSHDEKKLSNPEVVSWQWTSYAPQTSGFGSPTGMNMQYLRVGPSVYLRGYFTTGVNEASEARIYLPSGLTVDGLTSHIQAGTIFQDSTSAGRAIVLVKGGETYVKFGGINDGVLNPLEPINGDVINDSARVTIQAGPIAVSE